MQNNIPSNLFLLKQDRLAVYQYIENILTSNEEKQRFINFILKMPWGYAKDLPPEVISAHWKILRDTDFENESPFKQTLTIQNDIADSWIGPSSLTRIPRIFQKLDRNAKSPLLRAYFYDNDKFTILMAYPKSATREAPQPPAWLGLLKKHSINRRKEECSISFDPIVLEEQTLLRIEVINSTRTTVLRKIFEILNRHQTSPSAFELWTSFNEESPEDINSRRIKERHSLEIIIPQSLDNDIIESLRVDTFRYLVALLKVHSLFDIIGPAMVGPSSSHTAGATRIGQLSRSIILALQEAKYFNELKEITVKLLGSFRDSGVGHGTHIAIAAGLQGLAPDAADIKEKGDTKKLLKTGIPWINDKVVKFNGFHAAPITQDAKYIKLPGDCTNIAEIIAHTDTTTFVITGFSTGGSLVEIRYLNNIMLTPSPSGKQDYWIPADALNNNVQKLTLSPTPLENSGHIEKIYPQKAPAENCSPIFNTFGEALELCNEYNKTLLDLAIELESKLQGSTYDQIYANMLELWHIMKESVHKGLENQKRSTMDLSGGEASILLDYIKSNKFISFHTLAACYAFASAEINAQMGRIVACPTAGACGIIPGVLMAWYEMHKDLGLDTQELEKRVIESLIIAAFIGMIFYDDIPTAGASLGCQAEIGVGAAMAASAIVNLNGGSPEAVVHAAIIALKNCMGLVCDPVAGLVEVPCIKRNAMFSSFAITAADMAKAGIRSQIPPDEVVLAVKEVGEAMHSNYKESAKGGLATTLRGKDLYRQFSELCKGSLCSSCNACRQK